MYTIAAKQLRSGMARRRPPYGGRRGAGSKGATSAHSSSGTRSSASVVMARNHARPAQGSETTSNGARWRHPGATNPKSATIRHGLLFVYSHTTPFQATEAGAPHGYSRFRAYAVLEHGGNLRAAARALQQGPGRR